MRFSNICLKWAAYVNLWMINICDETTDVICKTKNSLEKKTEFFDLSIYFDILNQLY